MNRRTLIAGAGLALAGGAATATGATGLLRGEPSEAKPTTVAPGRLEYLTAGIDRLTWGAGETPNRAELRLQVADVAPPEYVRLHDADGKKRWEVTAPSDTERFELGVPFRSRGDWELAVDTGREWVSLVVPMAVSLAIDRFALDGDVLTVQVSNPAHAPNYLRGVKLFDGSMIHPIGRPETMLLPGEAWSKWLPYPAASYRDVELHVSDEYAGYTERKSFV